MAAFTLYDVLRNLVERSSWPGGEEDRRAAMESVNEAERMGVLGTVATMIECSHPGDLSAGRCEDCGRTIEVGHTPRVQYGPPTYQTWRA